MHIRSIATFMVTVLMVPAMVLAQANDQFIVNQFIGVDDPPTIPGNVIATPQSISAILVDWDASNDDTGLMGYEVYRDAMFLATVTAPTTNYNDTGLTASTSYTYEVRAFDTGYLYSNFSTGTATSTLAASTTVSTPAPASDGGGSQGSILSFTIGATPSTDAIDLTINASRPVRATITWSGTTGVALGTLAIPTLETAHETTLTGLRSGATYRITVTLTDERGVTQSRTITVTTTRGTDVTGPANPSNFSATPTQLGIRLTWDNPTDDDFENVRIMRQTGTIPVDPYDGTPVYEGSLEGYFDSDVVGGTVYGYAIFSRDESGNFSSGMVTLARAMSGVGDETIGDVTLDLRGPNGDLTSGMTITQGDSIHPIEEDTFTIVNDEPFLVSVPTHRFPKVLKTILVTLTHPDSSTKSFTFLLRANKEKTAYEARIDSLTHLGRYTATIALLDVSAQVVTKDDFAIEVVEGSTGPREEAPSREIVLWGRTLLTGLIALMVFLAMRRMWFLGTRARNEHRGTQHEPLNQ